MKRTQRVTLGFVRRSQSDRSDSNRRTRAPEARGVPTLPLSESCCRCRKGHADQKFGSQLSLKSTASPRIISPTGFTFGTDWEQGDKCLAAFRLVHPFQIELCVLHALATFDEITVYRVQFAISRLNDRRIVIRTVRLIFEMASYRPRSSFIV